MYICTECGEEKPAEMFGKDSRKKNGLNSYCKACKRVKNQRFYEANREEQIERTLAYYHDNRDRMRQQQNQWKKANRERMNAYEAMRAAQKEQRTPAWLSEEQKEWMGSIYETSKEVSEATQEPHHVDHIVPLRGREVCGLHVPWNLRVIPAEENMSKGNRLT